MAKVNPLAIAIGAFIGGAATLHFGSRATTSLGTTGAVLLTGPARDAAAAMAMVGAAKMGADWYQRLVVAKLTAKLTGG